MKYLKSLFIMFAFLGIFSMFAFTHTTNMDNRAEVTSKIEKFLSSVDHAAKKGETTIYSNFLISEDGFIYTVDFLLTDDDEVVVLSKDLEKEYYRVKTYNSNILQTYSVPAAEIISGKEIKV